jgi:hypothetical protein
MPQIRLHEVAKLTSDDGNPLDLWAGPTGEELGACYLATGSRKGGSSKVFRLRQGDSDGAWKDEGVPSGAETMGKIRNDSSHIYAFFETGGPFIISREIENPGWGFEPVEGPDFVGGRGLTVWEDTVVIGGAADWNLTLGAGHGRMFSGSHGGFGLAKEIDPGILWDAEYDEAGVLWEFWHRLTDSDPETAITYRGGEVIADPSEDVACAMAFQGEMYACGDLDERGNWVRRFNGESWEDVHTFNRSTMVDHVQRIPRLDGPPELWATGQEPFEVWRSFDGTNWEEVLLPNDEIIATNNDTNQLTAVGYFDKRVWVATFDDNQHCTRIFVDKLSDLYLQII